MSVLAAGRLLLVLSLGVTVARASSRVGAGSMAVVRSAAVAQAE